MTTRDIALNPDPSGKVGMAKCNRSCVRNRAPYTYKSIGADSVSQSIPSLVIRN
jgi:hypothetical protein